MAVSQVSFGLDQTSWPFRVMIGPEFGRPFIENNGGHRNYTEINLVSSPERRIALLHEIMADVVTPVRSEFRQQAMEEMNLL
jgi:hypothetical protein